MFIFIGGGGILKITTVNNSRFNQEGNKFHHDNTGGSD